MIKQAEITRILGEPVYLATSLSEVVFTGVCIDSRRVAPGDLFIAIRGESFDGHEFRSEAVKQGALGIICLSIDKNLHVPQWVVTEPIDALTQLATAHRQQFTIPVIALTGSNGKTTVKEMIAAILPKPSHATRGNYNNHIGVPLSVLQLNETHRAAVFELGANHLGEIASLAKIVQPQVSLVNNIAPAHVEGFGSIEGVAKAKGEIYQALSADGMAIVNDDDVYAHFWDSLLIGKRVIRYSANYPANVYARDVTLNAEGCAKFYMIAQGGEVQLELKVPGLHNVSNALAAASCTLAIGIPLSEIVTALALFTGVEGRMTYHYCKNHALIIDDTYNANLRSTLSALQVLARRPGRRIFVFGDMGELGDYSQQHHEEVGLAAKDYGIDLLLTCGNHSRFAASAFGKSAQHYAAKNSLIQDLLSYIDEDTTVLVKGSRLSAMESVVHGVLADQTREG